MSTPPRRPFYARQDMAGLWALPPLLVGLLVMTALLVLARNHGLWDASQKFMEGPLWPVFNDLKVMLDGIRLHSQGVDPLTAAYGSNGGYNYNYPRIWLLLEHAGVQHLSLSWAGFVLGSLWVIVTVCVVRPRSWGLSAALTVAFLSSPVVLALDRGNIDLLLFLLCAVAVWLGARNSSAWALPPLVALVALLKLYPAALFSFALFDFRNKRRLGLWLVMLSGVLLIWTLGIDEIRQISVKTPRSTGASIGIAVAPMVLLDRLGFDPANPAVFQLSIILYTAWLAALLWLGKKLIPLFMHTGASALEEAFFLMAALIYCGTFALGNNFVYRLIFILPALPLLWRILTGETRPPALMQWAMVTFGAATVLFFAPLQANLPTFLFAQAASWVLAGMLVMGILGVAKARLAAVAAQGSSQENAEGISAR